MKRLALATSLLAGCAPLLAATPVDTYFSVAITENSHNHSGENRLFLDFQQKADFSRRSERVVVSPKVAAGSRVLDGRLDDWDPAQFSTLNLRVMNNYPLGEFYDAVPVALKIASAYDEQNLYFALQFEDAAQDASTNRNRWVADGGRWVKQAHKKPAPATLAARAVNIDEQLHGRESEDRVFFMFPIVDQQRSFSAAGHGCAAYCHANLVRSGDPAETMIGEDVVGMHTSVAGDVADLWHWMATRTAAASTLKDAHLVYGEGVFNGRKADAGQAPDRDNLLEDGSGPAFVSRRDAEAGYYRQPGFATAVLREDDLLPVEQLDAMAPGVSVPFSILRPATGSRADVAVASHFDQATKLWTLELRRALDTGDSEHDRNFWLGEPAVAPADERVLGGDAERGEQLFREFSCVHCHGEQGEGKFVDGRWQYPRVQRSSGAMIYKTAHVERPKRQAELAYLKKTGDQADPLMPYLPISRQQAEDIAAWLQGRFIPAGGH